MLYQMIFVLHILGALLTGVIGSYALVQLWNKTAENYRKSALMLGGIASFEVLTGTILSVVSPQISAASLCGRIFLYLAIVGVIESVLFSRMNKIALRIPIHHILSPFIASMTLYLAALSRGF
jgi:hypothetical protein